MSKLLCSESAVFISTDKIYCFKLNENDPIVIYVPNISKNTNSSREHVDCMHISLCNQWLAVCLKKQLYIFKDLKLKNSAVLGKSASRVLFFNKQKTLLVADRGGVVHFYDFTEDALKKSSDTLGHNSMLTDALISHDDNFIITSDRDEKIRVTCYPNIYNIQSYCLGHEQFVSSINFLPSNGNVLVSASGDSTIRLWDYRNGLQLNIYRETKIKKAMVKSICTIRENVNAIVVQFFECDDLAILSVTGVNANQLKIELQTYVTVSLLLDCSSIKGSIVLLTNGLSDKIKELQVDEHSNEAIDHLVKNASRFLTDVVLMHNSEDFNIMFKREFDNVLEYHTRKKARITGLSSS